MSEFSGREGSSSHVLQLLMIKSSKVNEIADLEWSPRSLGTRRLTAVCLGFLLQSIFLKVTRIIFPTAKSELNCSMFRKCHLGYLFQLIKACSPFKPLLQGRAFLGKAWHLLLHHPTAPCTVSAAFIALHGKFHIINPLLKYKIFQDKSQIYSHLYPSA